MLAAKDAMSRMYQLPFCLRPTGTPESGTDRISNGSNELRTLQMAASAVSGRSRHQYQTSACGDAGTAGTGPAAFGDEVIQGSQRM